MRAYTIFLPLIPLAVFALGCDGSLASLTGGLDGGSVSGDHNGHDDLATSAPSDLATSALPDLAIPLPVVDPGSAGPLTTTHFDLTVPLGNGGMLTTTIYGPTDDGQTLSQKNAPYPTVVISPGFQLDRNLYAAYATRLASHGFLAVTQSYRNAGDHTADASDTSALLDWLITPSGPSAAKIAGRADAKRLGLTGHSLGGKVSFFTAERDARIVATIGIDPVDGTKPPFGMTQPSAIAGLGMLHGASGFLGETVSAAGGFGMPCAPAAENFLAFEKAAAAPSFAITFNDAGHMDFVDNPACLLCGFCVSGKANKTTTHDLAVKYVTAFFRQHLLGDAGALDYLTGAHFATDVATGAVTGQTK